MGISSRETGALDELTPQERRQNLLAEYQEISKSHADITDFRAKLLALLPIASGTGIGLLLTQADGEAGIPAWLVIALGTFGASVTTGLFVYEFHQMDDCQQLRNRAIWIETQLQIGTGPFGSKRGGLGPRDVWPSKYRQRDDELTAAERERDELPDAQPPVFVNVRTADYIVYGTAFAGWLAVLVWGLTLLA